MKIKVEMDWPEAEWEWDYNDSCWHCTNCKAVLEPADVSAHYYSFCYHCGHHMTLEQPRELYYCDPNKNTKCRKDACFINGGECRSTLDRKCAKENNDGTDIKTEER